MDSLIEAWTDSKTEIIEIDNQIEIVIQILTQMTDILVDLSTAQYDIKNIRRYTNQNF